MNLYPYQQVLLDRMKSGGFKPGEIMTMTSGRQTGKSHFSNQAFQRLWQDIIESGKTVSDMILSEGTIYGSRYYCVQPVGGNWREMEVWCTEILGDGTRALWGEKNVPTPPRRWYMNNSKFWFRDEKDRTMFILRWR